MNRLLASSLLTQAWLKNKSYKKQYDAKKTGATDRLERQELEDIHKYLNGLESRLASRQFDVDTSQIRLAELDEIIINRLGKLNPKNKKLKIQQVLLGLNAYRLQGIIGNAIESFPVRQEFKETLIDVANTVDALFNEKKYKTVLDEYGRKFHDMRAGWGWQLILIPQREKLIERDYWLLIIVHDWLLPDCEPIDQNRTLMRLGNLGFLVDLLLIDKDRDGLGIIKRAIAHVQANLASLKPAGKERDDEWIKVSEAAEILSVNTGTVTRWANKGRIKDNEKKGRKRRVLKSSVLFLKQSREDSEVLKDAKELRKDTRTIPDQH